jgi:hypothetical protein
MLLVQVQSPNAKEHRVLVSRTMVTWHPTPEEREREEIPFPSLLHSDPTDDCMVFTYIECALSTLSPLTDRSLPFGKFLKDTPAISHPSIQSSLHPKFNMIQNFSHFYYSKFMSDAAFKSLWYIYCNLN